MSEVDRIKVLEARAFSGGAWHGPSVEEVIRDVTAEQAAARPALGDHSIWQHVLHMIFWKDRVSAAARGAPIPTSSKVPPEENWPTVSDSSQEAWQKTLMELRASEARLQSALDGFSDERLLETVKGRDYSFYVAVHGVPDHDIYHSAQIALLKKHSALPPSIE